MQEFMVCTDNETALITSHFFCKAATVMLLYATRWHCWATQTQRHNPWFSLSIVVIKFSICKMSFSGLDRVSMTWSSRAHTHESMFRSCTGHLPQVPPCLTCSLSVCLLCLQPGSSVCADPAEMASHVRRRVPGLGSAHRLRDGPPSQSPQPVQPPRRTPRHLQIQDCKKNHGSGHCVQT